MLRNRIKTKINRIYIISAVCKFSFTRFSEEYFISRGFYLSNINILLYLFNILLNKFVCKTSFLWASGACCLQEYYSHKESLDHTFKNSGLISQV